MPLPTSGRACQTIVILRKIRPSALSINKLPPPELCKQTLHPDRAETARLQDHQDHTKLYAGAKLARAGRFEPGGQPGSGLIEFIWNKIIAQRLSQKN